MKVLSLYDGRHFKIILLKSILFVGSKRRSIKTVLSKTSSSHVWAIRSKLLVENNLYNAFFGFILISEGLIWEEVDFLVQLLKLQKR